MIKRFLIFLLAAFVVLGSGSAGWFYATMPRATEFAGVQDGDLAFQTSPSWHGLLIAITTHSLYTHAGIVKHGPKGDIMIVGIAETVKETPLDQWLRHGLLGRVTVKRRDGLTPAQTTGILNAARAYYGKPEDFLFLLDDTAIYASELVHEAFLQGAHLSLGRKQMLMELDIDNIFVRKLLAKHWGNYPFCQEYPNIQYTACVDMIIRQEVITPAAIARDRNLATIYDNYGLLPR